MIKPIRLVLLFCILNFSYAQDFLNERALDKSDLLIQDTFKTDNPKYIEYQKALNELQTIKGLKFEEKLKRKKVLQFPLIKSLSDKGNINATFLLSRFYKQGWGIEQSNEKAIECLVIASNNNHPSACNYLGLAYHRGKLVAQDYDKALKFFEKSVALEDPMGFNNLGLYYFHGKAVKKDLKKAAELFKKSADAGFADGQFNLANCYYAGIGIPKDQEKALVYLKKAADQYHYKAQSTYRTLTQYPANIEKANAGDAEAQYLIGSCYENGIGIDKDYEKALAWYIKSAKGNNEDAQVRLGFLYQTGISGAEMDLAKAKFYFGKAAAQGNPTAKYSLEDIEEQEKQPNEEEDEPLSDDEDEFVVYEGIDKYIKEVNDSTVKFLYEKDREYKYNQIQVLKDKMILSGPNAKKEFLLPNGIDQKVYLGKFFSHQKDGDFESYELIDRKESTYKYNYVHLYHDTKEYEKSLSDEDVSYKALKNLILVDDGGYFFAIVKVDGDRITYIDQDGNITTDIKFTEQKMLSIPKGYKSILD